MRENEEDEQNFFSTTNVVQIYSRHFFFFAKAIFHIYIEIFVIYFLFT